LIFRRQIFHRQTLACLAALSLAVAAPLLGPSGAVARTASTLTAEQQAMVNRAGDYIQNLKTVRGRFTQVDANGAITTGLLYLQRPGKARFEYDPPASLLVVSDGFNVAVHDRRLNNWNIYPLGQTPLVLLLAKHVRLDRGVVITDVEQVPGGFTIDASDGSKKAQGRITMNFSDSGAIALKGWTIVDLQGKETRVQLGPLTPADHLNPDLFNIRSQ
jgi:outer membrane lipoprotein-sorting protein